MTTDNNIRVSHEERPAQSEINLEVGLAVTMYGSYYAVPGTIILVETYKTGANKGQVKKIVVAEDENMGENNWNSRLDRTHSYKVAYLTGCFKNCQRFSQCYYCQGYRYRFVSLDEQGRMTRGSYNQPNWRNLGLGFREDYHNYNSEIYLSS
jgi:hypothetical protein